jgi:hypothetical protein
MNPEEWSTPTPHPNPLPSEGRGDSPVGNAGPLNLVQGFNARIFFRGNHLGPLPQERMNHSSLAGKTGRINLVQRFSECQFKEKLCFWPAVVFNFRNLDEFFTRFRSPQ